MYQSQKKKQETDEGDDREDKDEKEENAKTLPAMKKKDDVAWKRGRMLEKMTKPPTRFTASTLLAGMKEIHKYVKNPEAKKQLKDVYGIGTEATRATIIDDLIRRKFMKAEGKKKYLVPTPAAYLLVDALPDELTYPDSTAIWEDKLHSMSEGGESLADFLQGQIAFTRKLCAKAGDVHMEVKGENVCPRCHQGVLTKRKGKNGVFWGCSNYPKCRMTCNDKEGKPDLEDAKARLARRPRRAAPAAVSATAMAWQSRQADAPAASRSYSGAEPYDDIAALNALFLPDDYAARMEADEKSYAAQQQKTSSWQSWADKPKYSASPMEHMEKDVASSSFLCPRCREGHLRSIHGKNGVFWGCSNYPRCTATFDDDHGKPLLK